VHRAKEKGEEIFPFSFFYAHLRKIVAHRAKEEKRFFHDHQNFTPSLLSSVRINKKASACFALREKLLRPRS
jgi:tetraacyldisaccharide-1-P 4'-kinase